MREGPPDKRRFKSEQKREELFDIARTAKKPKTAGVEPPTKARIRLTYQKKLAWLSLWEKFRYQLADGSVIQGNMSEDDIVVLSEGQVAPTYLGQWASACASERWPELSKAELAAKGMRESIAKAHGLTVGKKGAKSKHPDEWADQLGKDLEPHLKGPAPPSTGSVAKSWVALKETKNTEIREKSRKLMTENIGVLQQFVDGSMALGDALHQTSDLPQEYHGNAGCSWVTGFKKQQGFNTAKSPRVSRRELADDDPVLQAQRAKVRTTIERDDIPVGLVANADQIWLTRGRLNHKNVLGVNLVKRLRRAAADPELVIIQGPLQNGKVTYAAEARAENDTWKGRLRPTRELAQIDLDWFQRLKDDGASYEDYDRALKLMGVKNKPRRKSQFAQAEPSRVELPSNARAPRTAITFGWMDGTPGKLQLQFGEGDISHVDTEWANTEHSDSVRVRCLEKRSHMCDAECIIEWLDTEVREEFRIPQAQEGAGAGP